MAVGELFLSAFVQVLFQQLASAATMALARREKVEGHFKKLSQSLTIIQAVLDDAEEKQLTEKSVKVWLESLRDLAYDLDDLLDEIITRALVQDSEEQAQNCNRTSRVWRFIPTCSSYMPGALVSNYRLMSRIKETNSQLQYIVKQRLELNLQENVGGLCSRSTVPRLPSTSLVNESHVYGRDEDKEKVIEMLLGNEDDISVIPIVGMGGIGKTTLAQIVYNDRRVKDSFHVRAWIWDLPEHHNILPVLRLSYHHLPSHLKHLFAYCSIFPKDYEFDRDELVLLWMGEGFLEQPNPRVRKEELGLQYFNELLSRSFFQRLGGSESSFVMHDLINDLAQFVAGGTCYRLDEKMDTSQEYRVPEKARHGSFLRHEYEVLQKFHTFYQVQGLRTFLPMPVQNSLVWPPFYLSNRILVELVPKLSSLRVLSLSGYSITELPSSICNLLHLRYLNLSGTSIVTLPYTLSALLHLQTLSLRNCRFICKLPPTLGNLSNLRHLDNSNTDQLKDMPVEIGNLRNLQTLPKIVLSKEGGCLGLKQLRDLRHLCRSLAIFELQNVMDIEDVKEANFRCKNDLDELQLMWGNEIDNSNDKIPEEDVIDHLLPHENLKSLKIEFYRGSNFPSWIGDPAFRKLSSISIGNCSECSSLPPLGQLPDLKHLRVGGMPKIKQVGTEFYGTGAIVTPFPKLENLRFDNMPEWQKWTGPTGSSCGNIEFPNLQHLSIFRCGKLAEVSPLTFPALRTLDVEECDMVLLERFSGLESLNYLKIESIFGLSHLPAEVMQSLVALEVLECCSCSELLSLWPEGVRLNQHLARLRRLVIASCSQLVSLGQGDHHLPPNLEVLELFRCTNLDSLPNNLSELESLRELIIKNCQRFVAFPESGIPRMLKRLEILSCNSLESLPANISGIERLEIKECSSLRTWAHFPEHGLPSGLRALSIEDCPSLKSLPARIRTMNSLVSLELRSCPRLDNFPRCDLPPNLTSLRIWDSKKFKPLSQWGLHRLASLREFSICGGFKDVELLGEDDCLFPPSLIKFSIARFPKLTSLGKVLENLTLLRHLLIMNCQNLNVLPREALLEKLWHLEISDCPLLRQRCAKDKGDYWPKIAGIPCVEIDGTYVYKQGSV
ncbi:Putative disease resistance RPP13-like protein 1 [Striga hermonthica]|uniref:Disease resistance RPP13-like protein 1 n=1 Tax=Striga hermonthica TaxID=68872 RepID=A0A9N7RB32_STRHE|nr:Putative disease resistance RPP13-like protein 1 [Striga hermonthica]